MVSSLRTPTPGMELAPDRGYSGGTRRVEQLTTTLQAQLQDHEAQMRRLVFDLETETVTLEAPLSPQPSALGAETTSLSGFGLAGVAA